MSLYTERQVQVRIQAAVAAAVAPLHTRIAFLEAVIARLKKNSSNSSKPPSSDIVKPPKPSTTRYSRKRRRGGQEGHPRHTRPAFPDDRIDERLPYELDLDPVVWEPLNAWDILQQVELKRDPLDIIEHRARLYRNRKTGEIRHTPIPSDILAAGLLGPRLTSFVAYLKGACHASYSTIETLLADVFDIPVCRGLLAKIVTCKVAAALKCPYEELLEALPQEPYLGIDETGHKNNGQSMWSWCFRAARFVLFHIAATRGAFVLFEKLGAAFDGVISCDYFSAYRKFMKNSAAIVQFCLAHLIRDVKFLNESTDAVTRNWARKTLIGFRKLFRLIHRRDSMSPVVFARALARCRDQLIARFLHAPDRAGTRDLRERFRLHPQQFFTFVTTPGIEPTNNMTEQAIRYLTIDRRITQGTRGCKGQRWSERIWTTISSCKLQNRSVFQFLCSAVVAHYKSQAPPSLLPLPP